MAKENFSNNYDKQTFSLTDKQKFFLTDKQKVFLSGFINLNIHKLEISWDLDQTLKITETPIKEKCDQDFNTRYIDKDVDGYGCISKWLLEDKVFTNENEAREYETKIWADSDILIKALPNQALRNLSYAAYLRNIPQSIVTVRSPALRQVTHKWLATYFPWIEPRNINLNVGGAIPGHEFKINTIKNAFDQNPNLIHVDDDMEIVRKLVKAAPEVNVIGITYPSDQISDLNVANNRIFLSRNELNSNIYYGSMNLNSLGRTM